MIYCKSVKRFENKSDMMKFWKSDENIGIICHKVWYAFRKFRSVNKQASKQAINASIVVESFAFVRVCVCVCVRGRARAREHTCN